MRATQLRALSEGRQVHEVGGILEQEVRRWGHAEGQAALTESMRSTCLRWEPCAK